jgi:hypothetical protein
MKLYYLGCSLSSNPYPDKPIRVAELLDLDLKNLAVPAGSNLLQCRRLQNEIISDSICSTDIVVWQITYATRPFARLPNAKSTEVEIAQSRFHNGHIHYVVSQPNIFDNKVRFDLLCNSPLNDVYVKDHDLEDQLETLLYSMIALKKICPNLLIYLGANTVMPLKYHKKFFSYLSMHAIEFLPESYLDWTIKNKLPIDDTLHPCAISARTFAEQIVYPRLSKYRG